MKGLARDDEISYPTHWYIKWRLKLRLLSDAFPVINFYSLMLIFIVSVLWFEKLNLICWKFYSNHQWWTNADGRTELMPCWLSATSIFGITLRLNWIMFHSQFDYVLDCCISFFFFLESVCWEVIFLLWWGCTNMSGHMKFVCDITVAFLLSRVINPLFLSFV